VISAFRSLYSGARRGARTAIDEFLWLHCLTKAVQPEAVVSCDFPVLGRYLVSSERGVFRITANHIERLCGLPAFGMAVVEDRVYLATWRDDWSIVLSGAREALLQGGDCGWREIYRVKVQSEAGRIHQIGALGDVLWLCNTALNTYTKIDRHTGRWLASIGPFRCSFGHPILVDHNHVNSVFPQPDYLLFTAFKINRRSVFGLAGRGLIRLFAYPNMGAHDCIIVGEDFYFSDSYRMWDGGGKGGAVLRNGKIIDPPYFDRNAAYFVRGIAGKRNEIVVGNSYIGDRLKRMDGEGALILIRDETVTHCTAVPFAQVYDIIHEDGTRFDRPPAAGSFHEASAILERHLGPCVEEFPLCNALIGEHQKKFDDRDVGEIAEYFSEGNDSVLPNMMKVGGQ
jgi:hypothetical protein